jgi:hypothetical protein
MGPCARVGWLDGVLVLLGDEVSAGPDGGRSQAGAEAGGKRHSHELGAALAWCHCLTRAPQQAPTLKPKPRSMSGKPLTPNP